MNSNGYKGPEQLSAITWGESPNPRPRAFPPKPATATGTLHVAGHHGGDELTFKLSRPRYNAARRTVSYKIKRLGNGRLPSRAAQAA